jgi:hypothetical protein
MFLSWRNPCNRRLRRRLWRPPARRSACSQKLAKLH